MVEAAQRAARESGGSEQEKEEAKLAGATVEARVRRLEKRVSRLDGMETEEAAWRRL